MNTQIRGSFQWMKSLNKSIILNKVRLEGPISRAKIAKQTQLTPPTVSNIVKELLESQLVIESTQGESSGGRKPTMLEINAQNFYVIGLDVGPKFLRSILSDLNGTILSSDIVKIPEQVTITKLVEMMKEAVHSITESNQDSKEKFIGIGIGMHGVVDVDKGISLYAPSLQLRNISLKEIFEEEFNLLVKVENDARALALGESWFGNGNGTQNVITVNVGRGIGAGIVIDGKLFRGKNQIAGEVGHMTVDIAGPQCDCGNHGCLQTLAAGPALVKRALRGMSMGTSTTIPDFIENIDLEELSGNDIFQAAKAGDIFSKDILYETGVYLGIGLTNIIHTLNPDRIVVGGGVSNAGDFILNPIKETIQKRSLTKEAKETEIALSMLGDYGTALGAVSLVLVELFTK
ncbi:ROK family transcriptional regulator [Halobacillus amylolyticus]|uniref:ROK family transcriptional regulator n=1 Tax=Halobacillus amylolyticus TaxID=2932259 RepID=A0ABY4H9Q1_9BACI|nr:ROK family transcriptional regulator [Halobacillus amylolyticus]UOR11590.1 ROK family transcriptional regulator [Halobacillus amylolyticus]